MARWRISAVAGLVAAAVCVAAAAWANAGDVESRRREIERETRLVAGQFADRLQDALEHHLLALAQMAAFFEHSEAVTEDEFQAFAATTLRRTPLCLRIPYVDTSLRVRWVHPPGPNRSLVGFDVRTHPEGHEVLLRARREQEPVLSPPLRLVGGDLGFVLAAPVFRGGAYFGQVVCSLRAADFFAAMTPPEVLERYEVRVRGSGIEIFATDGFEAARAAAAPAGQRFSLGGSTWEILARPADAIVGQRLGSGQPAFWFLGLLLALGAGGLAAAATGWAAAICARLRTQGAALDQTQGQLEGAMHRLLQAEKLTALGELVAGVAHEINNPLSTIMGYTQLLLGRDIPAEVKRRLETMHAEAERMARIVRNLLTFARKHPPEKKPLGLNDIIDRTLELKAYHFRVSQIQVEKVLAPDLPTTLLDFHQVQQVLLNLFNNAEQAMVESGRGGRLRIATVRRGDRIETRITDDGPGIPQEIQSRIFEPFFTTKKEGKGTGLGLSLCYGIVEEHGGTIRVESRPGEGTTFVIDLPVVQSAAVAPDAPAPAPAAPASSLRILVIDDEPALQDLLVDLLLERGHRVDTASDVPEALRKIAANGHDLIISDMKMPHGTGKEVYRAAMDRSPRLARRIIFTTGDGASAETRRFLEEAGNQIVLKPFKIEEIERAIAGAMRN